MEAPGPLKSHAQGLGIGRVKPSPRGGRQLGLLEAAPDLEPKNAGSIFYTYKYIDMQICMCIYLHIGLDLYKIFIYIYIYIYVYVYTRICRVTANASLGVHPGVDLGF